MSKELNELFGEVICSYTRKQALEDGVLVNMNQFTRMELLMEKIPLSKDKFIRGIIAGTIADLPTTFEVNLEEHKC